MKWGWRWQAVVDCALPFLVCEAGGMVAGYSYASPLINAPPVVIRLKIRCLSIGGLPGAAWGQRCPAA